MEYIVVCFVSFFVASSVLIWYLRKTNTLLRKDAVCYQGIIKANNEYIAYLQEEINKTLSADKDLLRNCRRLLDINVVQNNLIKKIGETTSELKILNLVTNYYCTPIEEQAKKLDN